ncbi:MAG TPA: cyclase family protein [Actinomycetota bacterium]|nr:cyclase family protein [Actinomycetota bacterium]
MIDTPRFIDLSHPIEDGMPVLPGLPPARIGAHLDHDASRPNYEGAEFYLGKVDMPANVGTYIDAPFHRFRHREDLAQVPLERIVGLAGVLIDATNSDGRGVSTGLPERDLAGCAVLVRTGWDEHWGDDSYWGAAPYLTEELALELVKRRVGLVGIDSWNVDDTTTTRRPIHTYLLEAGILVVEHLCNLDGLPPADFRFFAPVLAIRGGASFAIRAFAEL